MSLLKAATRTLVRFIAAPRDAPGSAETIDSLTRIARVSMEENLALKAELREARRQQWQAMNAGVAGNLRPTGHRQTVEEIIGDRNELRQELANRDSEIEALKRVITYNAESAKSTVDNLHEKLNRAKAEVDGASEHVNTLCKEREVIYTALYVDEEPGEGSRFDRALRKISSLKLLISAMGHQIKAESFPAVVEEPTKADIDELTKILAAGAGNGA